MVVWITGTGRVKKSNWTFHANILYHNQLKFPQSIVSDFSTGLGIPIPLWGRIPVFRVTHSPYFSQNVKKKQEANINKTLDALFSEMT